MSNYNSTLQSNNTDLQAILNTINELPEAGGIETCTGTLTINGQSPEKPVFYYVNANMELASINGDITGVTFNPIKNSIIFSCNWTSMSSFTGSISLINYGMLNVAYFVTGDFTLEYNS